MKSVLKDSRCGVPGTVKVASPTARTSPPLVVPDMMTVCLPLEEEAVLIVAGREEPEKRQGSSKSLVEQSVGQLQLIKMSS